MCPVCCSGQTSMCIISLHPTHHRATQTLGQYRPVLLSAMKETAREVTALSPGAQRSRAGPLLARAHTQGPGVGTLSQPRPEDSGLSDKGEWRPRLGRRHRDNYRHLVFHLCPRFTAVRPLMGQSPGTFTTGAGSRVTGSQKSPGEGGRQTRVPELLSVEPSGDLGRSPGTRVPWRSSSSSYM